MSISKGAYVNVPQFRKGRKRKLENDFTNKEWHNSYIEVWKSLQLKFEDLNKRISHDLVNDIVKFVSNYKFTKEYIPTALLFTGSNVPDHQDLFVIISKKMKCKLNCFVAQLNSCNSEQAKLLIETIVSNFVFHDETEMSINYDTDEEDTNSELAVSKRSQCTLPYLYRWYKRKFGFDYDVKKLGVTQPILVVIIPDIEAFSRNVLESFIKAISVYKNRLPLVLILGVVTSLNVIDRMFSYNALSELKIESFDSAPSVVFLNKTLEEIFLTLDCPFQLDGKTFQFLTDIFLYCDFSVKEFIRGIQFCIMDHFFKSNINVLCCTSEKISKTVNSLNEFQINDLLKLQSVRNFKASRNNETNLPDSPNVLNKLDIEILLKDLHKHLVKFKIAVRCLHLLTSSLSQQPLGKYIRQIYTKAMSENISNTKEYKACFEVLRCTPKHELLEKLHELIDMLSKYSEDSEISDIKNELQELYNNIKDSDIIKKTNSPRKINLSSSSKISDFKMKLKANLQRGKVVTEFEKTRNDAINFLLQNFFNRFLKSPTHFPFHEVMVYDNVQSLKKHFSGSVMASLHRVSTNPDSLCKCCSISNIGEIIRSMPDLFIAYKLYLESGSEINVGDWLKSFNAINEPDADNDKIDPRIHVRFLNAVTELQYLGFIESSSDKVDTLKKKCLSYKQMKAPKRRDFNI